MSKIAKTFILVLLFSFSNCYFYDSNRQQYELPAFYYPEQMQEMRDLGQRLAMKNVVEIQTENDRPPITTVADKENEIMFLIPKNYEGVPKIKFSLIPKDIMNSNLRDQKEVGTEKADIFEMQIDKIFREMFNIGNVPVLSDEYDPQTSDYNARSSKHKKVQIPTYGGDKVNTLFADGRKQTNFAPEFFSSQKDKKKIINNPIPKEENASNLQMIENDKKGVSHRLEEVHTEDIVLVKPITVKKRKHFRSNPQMTRSRLLRQEIQPLLKNAFENPPIRAKFTSSAKKYVSSDSDSWEQRDTEKNKLLDSANHTDNSWNDSYLNYYDESKKPEKKLEPNETDSFVNDNEEEYVSNNANNSTYKSNLVIIENELHNSKKSSKSVKRDQNALDEPKDINIVVNVATQKTEQKIGTQSHIKKMLHSTKKSSLDSKSANVNLNKTPFSVFLVEKNNDIDSKFFKLIIIIFSLISVTGLIVWIIPDIHKKKFLPWNANAASRTYNTYYDEPKESLLATKNYLSDREELYPKLQWQMDDGTWLSE